ncbi:MAG: hypothetical protein EOP85_20120, partial [Verrucomicrobiaceae bacterium]
MAEEYARISGGKIELEVVDPLRSSDRTQEVMATYGLPLTKDLLIIDARPDSSAVSTEGEEGSRVLNPNVKVVLAEDMVVFAKEGRNRVPKGFQGEDVMTARLVESIEGRAKKMVFVADKSKIDVEAETSPLKSLQDTLSLQNIDLKAINISGLKEIPADVEGVAFVAPRYDLTDEELAVLETYWNRPRAAILVILQAGEIPPKLRTFLRSNGVTPRRDRVIAKIEDRIVTTVRGEFTPGLDFTKDLALQSTVLDGATSSLDVRENDGDLINRQLNPVRLIQVAPEFWGETRFGEKDVAYDETEDNRGPLHVAAAVTRGAANDDRYAADVSRMVIIANTDFLDAENQRAENIDFLASCSNWLMDRQSLAGIGPRSLDTYKLPILDAQVSFINR